MENCYVNLAADESENVCDRYPKNRYTWTASVEVVQLGRKVKPWGYVFAELLRKNPSPTYPSGSGVCYGGLGPFGEGKCK